jgi:hypothetical protein
MDTKEVNGCLQASRRAIQFESFALQRSKGHYRACQNLDLSTQMHRCKGVCHVAVASKLMTMVRRPCILRSVLEGKVEYTLLLQRRVVSEGFNRLSLKDSHCEFTQGESFGVQDPNAHFPIRPKSGASSHSCKLQGCRLGRFLEQFYRDFGSSRHGDDSPTSRFCSTSRGHPKNVLNLICRRDPYLMLLFAFPWQSRNRSKTISKCADA